jgi:hypothetical protein
MIVDTPAAIVIVQTAARAETPMDSIIARAAATWYGDSA